MFAARMIERKHVLSTSLVAGAIILCAIIPIVWMNDSISMTWDQFAFHSNGVTSWLIAAAAVCLFLAQGYILYAAFEFETKWFLAVLLIPPATIFFMVKHWELARPAMPLLCFGIFFWILELLIE